MNTPRMPITIAATVNANVLKVWTSWTEPQHITQWCQASADWHAPKASNDLRTGGRFSTTMAARDGSAQFDFEGVYDHVDPQRSIEYSLADGRKVKIVFEDLGETTHITETFDPENENPEEMQRQGWQAILNNFKSYTESL